MCAKSIRARPAALRQLGNRSSNRAQILGAVGLVEIQAREAFLPRGGRARPDASGAPRYRQRILAFDLQSSPGVFEISPIYGMARPAPIP